MKSRVARVLVFSAITALPIVWLGFLVINGTGGWSVSGFEYFLGPIFLLVFLGATRVISRLGLFLARRGPLKVRATNNQVLGGCFIGLVLGVYASEKLRMHGFELMAERAKPVTEAMKDYVKETGEVPPSVAELIPDYLPQMPAKLPAFEIIREPAQLNNFGVDQWALQAVVSSGLVQWDWLIYHPAEIYSEIENGLSVKQVGNWGYFYD